MPVSIKTPLSREQARQLTAGDSCLISGVIYTARLTRTNENISIANKAVEELAGRMGCHFINVNQGQTDEVGKLKKEFTVEGIHMYANGYEVVLENMRPFL